MNPHVLITQLQLVDLGHVHYVPEMCLPLAFPALPISLDDNVGTSFRDFVGGI